MLWLLFSLLIILPIFVIGLGVSLKSNMSVWAITLNTFFMLPLGSTPIIYYGSMLIDSEEGGVYALIWAANLFPYLAAAVAIAGAIIYRKTKVYWKSFLPHIVLVLLYSAIYFYSAKNILNIPIEEPIIENIQ